MSVIKFLRSIAGLFNYSTDDNPTLQQDYIAAVQNWQETEKNLVDINLWQPTTEYAVGNQVKTPSLPSQYVLVCTAAGTSGNSEPDYTNVSQGNSVTDGTVTWLVSGYLPLNGGTITGDITVDKQTSNSGVYFTFPSSTEQSRVGIVGSGSDMGVALMSKFGSFNDSLLIVKGSNKSDNPLFQLSAGNGTTIKSLIGKPSGTLTWNGHSIVNEQTIVESNRSNLASSTNYTNKTSVSLTAGTWLIIANAMFPANATGVRGLGVQYTISGVTSTPTEQTQNAASNGTTCLNASTVVFFPNTTSVYVKVKQNSGSTLNNVIAEIAAHKLSDYTTYA